MNVLSLLIYGIYVTVGWNAALLMFLTIIHIFLTSKYPESIEDRSGNTPNLFELFFLSLTNLPNNSDMKIKNISLRVRINKIVTYVTFTIGLSIMTWMLVVHQSDPKACDWINHIYNEDTSSSILTCENLCDAETAFDNMKAALKNDTSPWAKMINLDHKTFFTNSDAYDIVGTLDKIGINNVSMYWIKEYINVKKDMNCTKMLLTSSHLLIWIGVTLFLLAFCIVQAICDYMQYGFFVKLHNRIAIEDNDDNK